MEHKVVDHLKPALRNIGAVEKVHTVNFDIHTEETCFLGAV